MLCVSFSDEEAREQLMREEDERRARSRLPRPEVRAALARDIGIKPGTIENIRRGRFSDLRTSVRDRIYGWMMRGLQQDIQRLEHELFMALQSGESPSSDAVVSAKAALAKAHEVLTKKEGLR